MKVTIIVAVYIVLRFRLRGEERRGEKRVNNMLLL